MKSFKIDWPMVIATIFCIVLIVIAFRADAQSSSTSTNVDNLNQRNESAVSSSGSYTQNIIGQGSGNFDQGTIPTYERKADVQCAVASMSADAFALNNNASIGAFRLGVTVPLTFGRCRDAFDDEVAKGKYELHVMKVEQKKQDILFQTKIAQVCMALHEAGVVITTDNMLYQECLQFQPTNIIHGKKHDRDPLILGFGKPSAHARERVQLDHLHE